MRVEPAKKLGTIDTVSLGLLPSCRSLQRKCMGDLEWDGEEWAVRFGARTAGYIPSIGRVSVSWGGWMEGWADG